MTNNIEFDAVSNSWNEHTSAGENHISTGVQVAQATTGQAASEPVPVDVGSGAPAQGAANAPAANQPAADANAPANAPASNAAQGNAPAANAAASNVPHEYHADAGNVVKLPANVSIDNIKVDGHNLVLVQPDGSEIVIKDGALNVPTFILGDVEVPRVALIAALEASHVDVAFGADGSISAGGNGSPGSAGGNFEHPAGGIGDGFGLSALLPPTDLAFGQPENRELFPGLVDRGVSVVAMSLLSPTEAASETGLNGGPQQSPGSDAPSNAETSSNGTITIDAPDGIGSIVINGVAVTTVGQQIQGQFGYITIVSLNTSTGVVEYNYTVTESVTHPIHTDGYDQNDTVPDNFSITVTDSDGDTASTTFAVAIIDDVPTAVADVDSVAAGQLGPATGNVLLGGTDAGDTNTTDGVADVQGADGAKVVGVAKGTTNADLDDTSTLDVQVQGAYGKLTLHADGSYTYVRDANTPGGVNDVFTYTIKDGDGDTSHTTLTISIGNSTPEISDLTPEANGGDVVVNEDDLLAGRGSGESAGSDTSKESTTQGGTFTIHSPDGIASLNIGGHDFITNGQFTGGSFTTALGNTLTVTAYNAATGEVSYTYTLVDNEAHDPIQGTNSLFENFDVTLTDMDGQSANSTLSVNIVDDAPTASAEASQNVTEGATVTGTLDFVAGADGATVTHINGTALVFDPVTHYSQAIDIGAGTIQVKADGSYSFTADASVNNSSGPVAVSATYTVTDGDGDTATAGIAFAVTDANHPSTGTASASVDDDGLAGGNPASTTGDIAVPNTDGDNNEATFSGTLGGSVGGDGAGANGFSFAALNGTSGTVGQESVTYSWNAANDTLTATGPRGALFTVHVTDPATGAYTVTLLDNVLQAQGPNDENNATVNLGYTITDADNSSTTGTLTITFNDDAPTASAEASQNVTEGATVTGTLDFVAGADGATVTHINGTALVFDPVTHYSQAIDIGAGTIQVKADGSYSFTADASVNNSSGPVAVSATYTVTDGDGDTATAGIAFAVTDANHPSTGTASASVDDDGLAGGNPASTTGDIAVPNTDGDNNEATFSGTLGGSVGGDGAGANGFSFAALNGTSGTVGQESVTYSWNAANDTLTATGPRGALFTVHVTDPATGAYTVTLLDNVLQAQGPNDENNATVNLGYTITDADNSSTTGTLTITFNDDAPTASAEASQNVTEGATVTGTLDFVAGADGATVTHINGTALVFDPVTHYSQAIDIGAGTIQVKADGSYSFTADASVNNSSGPVAVSATYTVTDGDGDTATAGIAFAVTDANHPSTGTASASVDDDGLAGGNPASTTGDIAVPNTDGDNNEATFSGTLGGSVGGDGAGANGFSFAALNGTSGTVGQESVTYSWNAANDTLTATGPRGALFTVHVTDPATGAYTVTLLDNVLQAQGPNDENNATVNLGYTITDADNSSTTGTLTITFNDDAPTASAEASQNVTEGATVTGTLDFVAGADGATVTHINGTALVFDPVTHYSQAIDIGAGTIQVKADGSYSFTADASVNNSSGPVAVSATYTVTDGDGDTATAGIAFAVTDANHPSTGTASASVDDDGLAGGNPASTTGDIAVPNTDGDNNEATFSGTLGGSVGGDGAGANGFSFAALNGTSGTVGQESVTYSWNAANDTLTATGPRGALFTVHVTDPATGAYTVTLLDNVLQAQGPNDENNATVNLGYTITDADNSSTTGTLTITFNDDAPTASAEASQNVTEGATVTGTLDFVAGADGATVTHINGTALVFDPVTHYSQAIDIGAGTIQVKADGSYSFTADASVNNSSGPVAVSATYTVTDGDGDTATAGIAFAVTDANHPSTGTASASVDDDGLAGGNPASTTGDIAVPNTDGDNNEATFSGTLGGSVGGDGAGANGFSFAALNGTSGTVGQESVTYSWNAANDTLTATGPRGALFTVHVTDPATGAYTVTLLDNVLQAQGPNDENNATVNLGYTITDADNSSTTGTLTITFNDDAPTASAEASQNVTEGATVTGTLDFVAGADGATVTHINGTALVFDPVTHYSQAIDIGAGTIQVKADGSYSFTADASVNNSSGPVAVSATYTVTDGDGDTATAGIAFAVTDANHPSTGTASASVDDDGLAGGNPASTTGDIAVPNTDGDNNEATFSGTLGGSVGGDGAGANGFSFAALNGTSGTVGQESVTYSWNAANDTLTATGPRGALFTVHVTDPATGAYTVTLLDNVLQAQGPNDENNATVNLGYTITDADNSSTTGTLTITFNDDAPTASAEASQNVTEGATVTGTLDFVAGADGATVTHINGTALVFDPVTHYSQAIDIGAGTIQVKADGSYSFTADASVNNSSGPVAVSATYTVTDGDGDTATAGIAFAVTDANHPSTGTASASVDDDGLAGGNPASTTGDIAVPNTDGDNNEATFSGTLGGSVGGDGAGANGFSFAALNGTSGTVGQESVTYSWNAANDTLTATGPRGALFTVHVTDPATGTYTVTLLDNVLQAQGPNDENNATVNLGYTITDADGSTAPGTLTITFNDDAPTALSPETAVLINAVNSIATFDLDWDANIDNNVGADQLGSISFANVVNGQQATGVINGSTVNLTSGGQPILLYLVDHDNNPATPMQLQGWTGGLGTGTEIFQITLQPDGSLASSSDHYQVEVFAAIGATEQTHIDNFSALGSNSQQFKALDVAGTTQDLLFSGYVTQANGTSNAATGSAVSASTTGIGVGNNSMNDGDNLRIDFVNDLTVSTGNNNTYDYSTHYNVNDFQFAIVQVNGSPPADSIETWVRIYNAGDDDPNTNTAADAAALANDAQLTTITDIKVNGVSLNLASLTTDGHGGYLITGLDLHDTVLVTASGSGYDRIEIENAIAPGTSSLNGESFDIGAFAFVTTVTNVPSVELNFDLLLKDADGDTSTSSLAVDLLSSGSVTSDHSSSGSGVTETAAAGVINIIGSDFADSLTGNGSNNVLAGMNGNDTLHGAGGNDLLIGGLGDDTLYGDDGNDIIYGGSGLNHLTGGAGADTFVIDASKLTVHVADVIADYTPGQDVIDLSELLKSLGGDAPTTDPQVGDSVNVTFSNGDAHVMVDDNGTAAGGNMVEVATLTGVGVGSTISILYDHSQPAHTETVTV